MIHYMQRFVFLLWLVFCCCLLFAQHSPTASPASSTGSLHAAELAESGHCVEALPLLQSAIRRGSDKKALLRTGIDGVRCAMSLGNTEATLKFLQVLTRELPNDPDVLYLSIHTYSDLATRSSQELARTAPNTYQARELNAETYEIEGKWDKAAQEYRKALADNPDAPGLHFRLGRLLLSESNPPPDVAEQARMEFQAELKIDPSNAGAEYVLGELARKDQNWEEAIQHFTKASKLDPRFGDAYLGLGQSLIAAKKFPEAIAPLEAAVKLESANPVAHYNLATAYSRSGKKAEADKEFAIHRQMTQKEPPPENKGQENPN